MSSLTLTNSKGLRAISNTGGILLVFGYMLGGLEEFPQVTNHILVAMVKR